MTAMKTRQKEAETKATILLRMTPKAETRNLSKIIERDRVMVE
jgi:hypothetical protein